MTRDGVKEKRHRGALRRDTCHKHLAVNELPNQGPNAYTSDARLFPSRPLTNCAQTEHRAHAQSLWHGRYGTLREGFSRAVTSGQGNARSHYGRGTLRARIGREPKVG